MNDTPVSRRDLTATILAGTAGVALAGSPAAAQNMDGADITTRLAMVEDQLALKTLVDTFSNLADIKDIETQVQLFTEDATVDSWSNGAQMSSFTGREALAKAFGGFLAQFDTVYHMNGQQTVVLSGDEATGTAYCLVVLIGEIDGKVMQRTSGVRYEDRYVRQDGVWLIAGRTSHFEWNEMTELPA